jgi:hypothetical protein
LFAGRQETVELTIPDPALYSEMASRESCLSSKLEKEPSEADGLALPDSMA